MLYLQRKHQWESAEGMEVEESASPVVHKEKKKKKHKQLQEGETSTNETTETTEAEGENSVSYCTNKILSKFF